ncbi:MAG: MATE family efflux transporter [Bacillus sp. (in: Bacteria)]|nr:MATE family efflux transporter [Bacillus sp. (in: firmicutes)]MCM1425875.1 MATE family efflux transporter [Eubacterium sp.]
METENRMETAPIQRLLLVNSVPLMLSLLFSTLYNTVDSMFIAQIGEEALTAVSLAAPMQLLMDALGSGIALGLNAAVSKALGEKDKDTVQKTVSAGLSLAFCAWVILAVIGMTAVKSFFFWQSGGNEKIAAYGISYLSICMIFSLVSMMQWVFDRCLIAAGHSSLFLISLGGASFINLLLDPVFIFGWFGLPAMGTAGAAIATMIGKTCGALIALFLNLCYNKEIPIRFTFRPNIHCLAGILRVGTPTAFMQGLTCAAGILMNTILVSFSSTAVAVAGICSRIQNLSLIGVHGVCLGMIPIAAYNYGAKNRQRIFRTLYLALVDAIIIFSVSFFILELIAKQILLLFNASEEMLFIGVPAIRILSFSYFISVSGILVSHFFQALGRALSSMILTLVRQVVFLLPCAALLAQTGHIERVWYAYVFAELLALPIILFLLKRAKKVLADLR